MRNQLLFLYIALRDFLEPLRQSFSSPEALEYLFFRYGWKVSLTETEFEHIERRSSLITPLEQFLQEAETLQETLGNNGDSLPDPAQIAPVAQSAHQLFKALADLQLSNLSDLAEPLNQSAFWRDIGDHILDDLLEEYLRVYYSNGYLLLHLFGVIRYELRQPAGPHRRPYTRTVVDWDQAAAIINNPLAAFQQAYHWDDPDHEFEHQRLFAALEKALRAIGLSAGLATPDAQIVSDLQNNAFKVISDEDALRIQVLYQLSHTNLTVYEIGLEIMPAARSAQSTAGGLVLSPVLRGELGTDLPVSRDFSLRWSAGADAGSLLAAAVFPDQVEWADGQASAETNLEFASRYTSPRHLLGNSQTARIELSNVSIRLSIDGPADSPEIKLHLKTGESNGEPGCRAVIPLDEADEFVKESLNTSSFEFTFAAEISWSSKTGLRFNGGSGLDIQLPVEIKMGPVTLQNARLALTEGNKETSFSSVELRLGADVQGELGPVSFVVEQLGFTCQAIPYGRQDILDLPPDQAPVLGNLDLRLAFAPPAGIGIKIDTGSVVGGGYLFFDPEKEEYAGVVQLAFGQIEVQAIGLITTRLPGGEAGFSLLIMITAEGFTPINLGFGFTLNGVGGLLALNRTAAVDVLRRGLKERTLDAVLFPEDPVRNAPRIIRDLATVFPPSPGRYLFGPMALIAWGTPTVLTIELGLVLEFPAPLRLIALGQFRARLPSEEKALIRLNMDALGVVNFDAGKIAIDATLYDSRILDYTVSGDMALRAEWRTEPAFALAVGGLHPRFQPPPGFPTLERVAISLTSGNNPRLRLEAYLALTSNTAQIGARLDLYAAAAGFSIEGYLHFDTLFQFSPFQFVADIGAGVALKRGSRTLMSVHLELMLSGPAPWHARGKATFKVFLFKGSISFDKKFGADERPPTLPAADPLPELLQALADSRNWSAQLPGAEPMLVSLREILISGVLVHPLGELTVRQRIVPLNVEISRYGNTAPSGDRRFTISQVLIHEPQGEDQVPAGTTPVKDYFAPAQFLAMSDSDRLSNPSFQRMDSGLRIGMDGIAYGGQEDPELMTIADLEYETEIVGAEERVTPPQERYRVPDSVLERLASQGAAGRSPMRHAGQARYRAPGKAVRLQETTYVVASTEDLTAVELEGLEKTAGDSYTAAAAALRQHLAQRPQDRDRLQVVPRYETEGEPA